MKTSQGSMSRPLFAQPRVQRVLVPAIVAAILLLIWQAIVVIGKVPAYLVPFALLQVVSGTIGERIGRRRAVRVAYLVYAGALLLSAVATSFDVFLASRALQARERWPDVLEVEEVVAFVLADSKQELCLARRRGED